jgi:hypothetical protein
MKLEKDPIICNYPNKISLSVLEKMLEQKDESDKEKFISIIEHRLSNRFLKVIDKADKSDVSSFMIMAICCLIIETLECFYQGYPDTNKPRSGKAVFKSFFQRENQLFQGLDKKSIDFYKSVRCGILHQAETMNGWFLNKNGNLFEQEGKVKLINGDLFFQMTKKSISNYLELLHSSSFTDEIWTKAFDKLIQVCINCNDINVIDESK